MSALPWQLIATYVTGLATSPLIQRALGSAATEARRRWESVSAARRLVAMQLDPLLKAADELQAKLRSLAEEDFRDFRTLPVCDLPRVDLVNLCSTLYLFAQFWGRLEIVRRESFNVELARNSQGKVLLRFLRCLQSRRVRLVDRAWQRAIGESIVLAAKPTADLLYLKHLSSSMKQPRRLENGSSPWRQTKFPRSRQRVLQYGVIVHALIDTLDPKHYATRERPAYPNKLSRKTKHELIGKVFGTYLPDVHHVEKYTGIHR